MQQATHADSMLILMLSVKLVTVGVHSWLPDAMEGPTAVSSVIHAATLVVAGALWLLRAPSSTWLLHSLHPMIQMTVYTFSNSLLDMVQKVGYCI